MTTEEIKATIERRKEFHSGTLDGIPSNPTLRIEMHDGPCQFDKLKKSVIEQHSEKIKAKA